MPKWFTRCVKRFWRIDTKHFCCSKLRYTKTVYCVVFISSWTCRQLFNPHRIALGYFMFSNSCCFMFHLSQRSICGVVVARVVVAASASALAISQTTTSKTGFGLYMRHGVLRGGNKKGDFFFLVDPRLLGAAAELNSCMVARAPSWSKSHLSNWISSARP